MIFLILMNILDNNTPINRRILFELERLKKYLQNRDIEIKQITKKEELQILEEYLKKYYDEIIKLDKSCTIINDLYLLSVKNSPTRFRELLNFGNEFKDLYLIHLKNLVKLEYTQVIKPAIKFEIEHENILEENFWEHK